MTIGEVLDFSYKMFWKVIRARSTRVAINESWRVKVKKKKWIILLFCCFLLQLSMGWASFSQDLKIQTVSNSISCELLSQPLIKTKSSEQRFIESTLGWVELIWKII